MSEPVENRSETGEGRLAATLREVKNAIADRDDVVVDIREAQFTRLELLADELKPVFAEVPHDDDWFDLVISSGAQPRLWIDAVAHVTMARDRRTYRFLRDTRLGRVVLAESSDMKPVADQVTRYIAERMIERRRAMEGDTIALERAPAPPPAPEERAGAGASVSAILRSLLVILVGGLVGVAAVLAFTGGWLERLGLTF
ncbi:MAG: hypothetical protein M9945_16980 [Aquamicrobium sp.]|jgi:hypothetical protein|uniref:hypothetical protein n=1 Tax=Aquamicrobium sp. TaxID=1872579 RepID=UPI00349E9355|nr:hypothetical protein [Aquamicrobium sp.]